MERYLKSVPKEILRGHLTACQTLLNKYKYPHHCHSIDSCHLCASADVAMNHPSIRLAYECLTVDDDACIACPWVIFTGDRCSAPIARIKGKRPYWSELRNSKVIQSLEDAKVLGYDFDLEATNIELECWRLLRINQLSDWVSKLDTLIFSI